MQAALTEKKTKNKIDEKLKQAQLHREAQEQGKAEKLRKIFLVSLHLVFANFFVLRLVTNSCCFHVAGKGAKDQGESTKETT